MNEETTLKQTSSAEIVTKEGYGVLLSQARESKGLTIEQVASQLRLSPKQISQMEMQDSNAFPTAVYTRAHLRGYARLVGLDESLVVERFNQTIGLNETDPKKFVSQTSQGLTAHKTEVVISNKKGRGLTYLLFALLVLVVGSTGWYFYNSYKAEQQAKQIAIEQAMLAEQQRQAEEEKLRAEALKKEQERLEALKAQQEKEKALLAQKEREKNRPLVATVNGKHQVVLFVPEAGTNAPKISFVVKEGSNNKSWIGSYDEMGRLVFNKTLSGGQAEEISVKLPLRLSFGDMSIVSLTINGRPIEFRQQLQKAGTRHLIVRAKK